MLKQKVVNIAQTANSPWPHAWSSPRGHRPAFLGGRAAGLPPGTRVAHKTGWIGGVVYHDAGIVYPPPGGGSPYVLVVLTGGIEQDSVAYALVSDVSRMIARRAAGGF